MAGWRGIPQRSGRGVCSISSLDKIRFSLTLTMNGVAPRSLTLLPLVEHWWTWMIYAGLLWIGESLPTSLVNAFTGHGV